MSRELQNICDSGELTGIRIGDTGAEKVLQTQEALDARVGSGDLPAVKGDVFVAAVSASMGKATITNNLTVGQNLIMEEASDPTFVGTYLRAGAGGVIYFYKQPDPDTKWTDTDTNDRLLTVAPLQGIGLSVTLDEDLPAGEGSFELVLKIDNVHNNARTVTLSFRVNDVEKGTDVINISGQSTGNLIGYSAPIVDALSNGDVITIEAYCSNDDNCTITGASFTSTLTITKSPTPALMKELTPLIAAIDTVDANAHRVFTSPAPLGLTLTKAEIVAALGPAVIEDKGSFFVTDTIRLFTVIHTGGRYFYERLEEAT